MATELATQGQGQTPATGPAKGPPAAGLARTMDKWILMLAGRQAAGDRDDSKARGTRDRIERDMLALAAELAGPSPTPIERTLAETAAVCWQDARYAQSGVFESADGLTLAQIEYRQRTASRALARYTTVLKTLATVRRLAVPAIQVNIGQNQVNAVAGGGD